MLNLATNSNAQIHPARRPQDSAVFRNNDRYDAAFLDQSVPLRGASHAEVTRYSVEVPMRYSECFAILTDGTKVPLANKRQFLAWAGARDDCSVMFNANGQHVEAQAAATSRRPQSYVAIDGAIFSC
tara:strand:- start:11996 stop:12376 length:381 start_codon:yes stop_codon:yes gene_type:complete